MSERLSYAFTLSLPADLDLRLRRWSDSTQGATWDASGGHVTLARLSGDQLVPKVKDAFLRACRGVEPFDAEFSKPVRAPYWDKPGLEIVMLVGSEDTDVAGVFALRERMLEALLATGLQLLEAGEYVPHVTLTTGLPTGEARRLEAAAGGLELRFRAAEVVFWVGRESGQPDEVWAVVERVALGDRRT